MAHTIHTLDVPGAVLRYEIRATEQGAEPVLLLIGSPMGADGFAALAERFPGRASSPTIHAVPAAAVARMVRASRRPRNTPTTSTASSRRSLQARPISSPRVVAP